MHDGQKVITIAHPEHISGELKIKDQINNLLICINGLTVTFFFNVVVSQGISVENHLSFASPLQSRHLKKQ